MDAGSRAAGWGPDWRPTAAGSGPDGRGIEGDRVATLLSLEAERGCAVCGQWSVVWGRVCFRSLDMNALNPSGARFWQRGAFSPGRSGWPQPRGRSGGFTCLGRGCRRRRSPRGANGLFVLEPPAAVSASAQGLTGRSPGRWEPRLPHVPARG